MKGARRLETIGIKETVLQHLDCHFLWFKIKRFVRGGDFVSISVYLTGKLSFAGHALIVESVSDHRARNQG